MKSTNGTFQLENFVPGAFLTQGLAGGMLAGFALLLGATLWTTSPDPIFFLLVTPWVIIAGATLGVIKAAIIWAGYRFIGIEMPAAVRVVIAVITIRLVTMFFGLRWGMADQNPFIMGLGIALLAGVPIALLVGSGVKPWQLFTFGSIVVGPSEFERREGSSSILGTLGSLPLRFLSIVTLAAWILYVFCQREVQGGITETISALLIPAIYPAFSAYVTFRSPHKTILVLIGLVVNIPVALFALVGSGKYIQTYWFAEVLLQRSWICTAFLIGWGIFLLARVKAQTNSPLTLDDMLRNRPMLTPGRFQ